MCIHMFSAIKEMSNVVFHIMGVLILEFMRMPKYSVSSR